jgi:DNA-binding MarR family transcriptional regulator
MEMSGSGPNRPCQTGTRVIGLCPPRRRDMTGRMPISPRWIWRPCRRWPAAVNRPPPLPVKWLIWRRAWRRWPTNWWASRADVAEADCIAFLEGQFRICRLRVRHLPGLSLGEPAWDILLDLAVAHYWRRETSVTSLCIAADVPSTTALRWINGMTKEGLIVRRPCQRDGRRSFLGISPESYQAMLALAADAMRTADRVRARYQRSAAA